MIYQQGAFNCILETATEYLNKKNQSWARNNNFLRRENRQRVKAAMTLTNFKHC